MTTITVEVPECQNVTITFTKDPVKVWNKERNELTLAIYRNLQELAAELGGRINFTPQAIASWDNGKIRYPQVYSTVGIGLNGDLLLTVIIKGSINKVDVVVSRQISASGKTEEFTLFISSGVEDLMQKIRSLIADAENFELSDNFARFNQ